jgi:hypothetical protein
MNRYLQYTYFYPCDLSTRARGDPQCSVPDPDPVLYCLNTWGMFRFPEKEITEVSVISKNTWTHKKVFLKTCDVKEISEVSEITEFFEVMELSKASRPKFPFLKVWTLLVWYETSTNIFLFCYSLFSILCSEKKVFITYQSQY